MRLTPGRHDSRVYLLAQTSVEFHTFHMRIEPHFLVGLGAREAWGLFNEEGMRIPARDIGVEERIWVWGEWTDDWGEWGTDFVGKARETKRLYGMSQEALAREILRQSDSGLIEAINENDSLSAVLGESRDPAILSTSMDVHYEYFPRVCRLFDVGTRFPADVLPLLAKSPELEIEASTLSESLRDSGIRLGDMTRELVEGKPETVAASDLAEWADSGGLRLGRELVDVVLWCLETIHMKSCDHVFESMVGITDPTTCNC